jgi:hypothetical protein
METENFTPSETRKTLKYAALCAVAVVLAFKFSFADFWRFALDLAGIVFK